MLQAVKITGLKPRHYREEKRGRQIALLQKSNTGKCMLDWHGYE